MTALDNNLAPPAASTFDWRSVMQKLGPVIGLIFVFGLFGSLRPNRFLTVDNFQIMLLQTAVVGTAALGMTLIIISGGIDLSVGSNIALCTVIVARLLNVGAPPLVAAAGGIAAGAAVGLLTGLLITGLGLSPFIVTLGLWGSIRGMANWSGGSSTVVPRKETWLNDLLNPLPAGQQWMVFPPGVWVTILLALLVAGVLRYTKFGRHVFALGSNEQTARLCGVPVARTKIMIYTLAATLVGVSGVLQFSYLTLGDPTTAAGRELDVIAAVVIGGASLSGGEGTILGSLIGALMMTAVANGCTKVGLSNAVQLIVTGGIIVLAAALDRLRHRRAT